MTGLENVQVRWWRFLDVSKSTVMVPMFLGGGVFIMVIMRMHGATNSANPAACVGDEV